MNDTEARMRKLNQIPVFALRSEMYARIAMDPGRVQALFRTVLDRRPRDLRKAIQRLRGEDLRKLVEACPDISDERIDSLFEEYRYSRASFHLYMFDPASYPARALAEAQQRLELLLRQVNQEIGSGQPKIKEYSLTGDLVEVEEGLLEGTYRLLRRVDYIDSREAPDSIYESVYGFFWVHTRKGYAIIQPTVPGALSVLQDVIERAFGVALTGVNVTKELKNALFSRDDFSRETLVDPEGRHDHFEQITVADEQAYAKGLEQMEAEYPLIPSLRYREEVRPGKKRSLTISARRGGFTLAGRLTASEFREWCIRRMEQVVQALEEFRFRGIPDYVAAIALRNSQELTGVSSAGKDRLVEIVGSIVAVKQEPGLALTATACPTIDYALMLPRHLRTRVLVECELCDETNYISCPTCRSAYFQMFREREDVLLRCPQCGMVQGPFPYQGKCDLGHDVSVSLEELETAVTLVPTPDGIATIARMINNRVPGVDFHQEEECFTLSGGSIHYYVLGEALFGFDELPVFSQVPSWDEIPPRTKGALRKVILGLGEKCDSHSTENCQACPEFPISERVCLMKLHHLPTGCLLHPHSGFEFGDIAFDVTLRGRTVTFKGLAKSYKKGQQRLRGNFGKDLHGQFTIALLEPAIGGVAVITPTVFEDGYRAHMVHDARVHKKNLVFIGERELVRLLHGNRLSER